MKKMKLYHVTDVKNIKDILTKGLKSGTDGYIYLFENKSFYHPFTKKLIYVADTIARNQVFLYDKYAMFEVDVDGYELEEDKVAEFSAQCQKRIKTRRIPKRKVSFFGTFQFNPETREYDAA